MPGSHVFLALLVSFACCWTHSSSAADSPGGIDLANLAIPLIDQEPELGDFAGMTPATALARDMVRVSDFVQREPADGQPPSQRTDVYLGYDQSTLYAVFLAFDTEPGLIRANMASRENIGGDDSVELTIDTFNDQRTAYTFRVTPFGVQWDARWTEGASNRAGFDTSWEAVWDSEGVLTDQGYVVKMAIPLRGLRFPDSSEQLWRVQLGRQIPRLSENIYWPAYSLRREGRLNQTAMLTGIRDVSPGNNTQIIPFVFARTVDALDMRAAGGPKIDGSTEQDVGVDAKFVFNDAWVLDVTLNPDFSQVESDQPQVTVNERFEVQYPERRPFFVENADFFATDSILVFTRRIVDPEGGLRFTGRRDGWGFGAMLMNDEAPGLNRSAADPLQGEKANIGIVRGFRDLAGQDRVGFLLTDRELADGYNRVASVDGRFKLTDNWVTNLQFVGSETEPALGGDSMSGIQSNVSVDHTGRTFNSHVHFIDTQEDFRAQLGFQNRFFKSDTSGIHSRFDLTFYPENSVLNSWSPALFGVYQNDQEGMKVYSQLGPSLNLRFDTSRFSAGYTEFSEILRPQDFSGLPTTRVYDYDNWNVSYRNDFFSSLGFNVSYQAGTALNLVPPIGELPNVADSNSMDIGLTWRPIDRLRINNTLLRTELESRGGAGNIFSNEIIRSNWNYQFTRELSLRFIAQYEEVDAGATRLQDDENMNYDLLMRYVINPWSALYLGYNSNSSNFDIVETENGRELITTNELKKDGDQFFVKFSYLFQR
ncbi:MAG: DUF5916 domain-containing protein [Pseudohongiellaceae bacterium]